MLYKDKKDVIVSLEVFEKEDVVELLFLADCGKHGTHEIIDSYTLKPERLLDILRDRDDYTDEELR